jgi:hypothetical protein
MWQVRQALLNACCPSASCDAWGRAEGDESTYAIPLNSIAEKTRAGRAAGESMISSPSCFAARDANAQAQKSFAFVFDLNCGVATQVQFVRGG